MEWLRALASLCVWMFSINGLLDLYFDGFEWHLCAAVIVGFLLAYWLWPSQREKDPDDPLLWFMDLLELIIASPIRLLISALRSLGSVVRDFD